MGHWFYVAVGWTIVAAAVSLYAARLLGRGRRLTQSVPAERRRWT